jgi:diguanylate cyclase (GGDEF)-like protein
MFIGHTHWDHIQGFPFFGPARDSDTELNIYAPRGFQRNLEESLSGQMHYSYFPVKLGDLQSRIHFAELEEGFLRVGNVLVETQHLNHTAPTIAYRITGDGATLAYVTDHEPFWRPDGNHFLHPGDQRHVSFLKGADLIIHDAQYTEEEYLSRLSWGHGTFDYATDVAISAEAQRLALFHHDPNRDDDELSHLEELAQKRARERSGTIEVFAAAEGMEFELHGRGRLPEVSELSALRQRPIAGSHILLISANDPEVAAISQELQEDNLVLLRAPDARTALGFTREVEPDLIIIGSELPDGEPTEVINRLRNRLGRHDIPVLVVTEEPDPRALHRQSSDEVIDYLARPLSPPMLHSRVRAWLARAADHAALIATSAPVSMLHRTNTPMAAETTFTDGGVSAAEVFASALRNMALFRSLSAEQLEHLVRHASIQSFDGDARIIEQGQPGYDLYVLLSGRVRVVEAPSEDPSGMELVLSELGPGEIFGELGILSDKPRSATVKAVGPIRCLSLAREDFLEVVHAAPDLSNALLRILSDRVYEADRRLARYAPDTLTGVANRRAFYEQYPRFAAQARRRDASVLLLLVDVVNLRSVNDRFGYAVGDEVLRAVADSLIEASRRTDLVARIGGDEFAAILVEADANAGEAVVDRIHGQLAEIATRRSLPLTVEVSVGVASRQSPSDSVDELLREADLDMRQKLGVQTSVVTGLSAASG